MPAHSDWLTNGGEAARGRVKHLHACFPSAPQSVIEKILHISKDNLDFAKDVSGSLQLSKAPSYIPPFRRPAGIAPVLTVQS